MENFRYLPHVSTLKLDESLCSGCEACTLVCPHGVMAMKGRKVQVVDHDGCMECGACLNNCATGAINLSPGVGCAAFIIKAWLKGKGVTSCETSGCC
jgi:NAD-dependent dihydropyrimidine dehydrogenase PreA subunit